MFPSRRKYISKILMLLSSIKVSFSQSSKINTIKRHLEAWRSLEISLEQEFHQYNQDLDSSPTVKKKHQFWDQQLLLKDINLLQQLVSLSQKLKEGSSQRLLYRKSINLSK
jgi:hypothetical protein